MGSRGCTPAIAAAHRVHPGSAERRVARSMAGRRLPGHPWPSPWMEGAVGHPHGLVRVRVRWLGQRRHSRAALPRRVRCGRKLTGWGPAGTDLILLSAHASPNPTSREYLAHYPAPGTIRCRDGGQDPRHRGRLFDTDVVLETIARCGPHVIACGDLNEARGWDDV